LSTFETFLLLRFTCSTQATRAEACRKSDIGADNGAANHAQGNARSAHHIALTGRLVLWRCLKETERDVRVMGVCWCSERACQRGGFMMMSQTAKICHRWTRYRNGQAKENSRIQGRSRDGTQKCRGLGWRSTPWLSWGLSPVLEHLHSAPSAEGGGVIAPCRNQVQVSPTSPPSKQSKHFKQHARQLFMDLHG
jgi:hypothetical protein